jgi:hypothetical protein
MGKGDVLPEGRNGVTVSLVDIARAAQRRDRKDLEGSLLPQSGAELGSGNSAF